MSPASKISSARVRTQRWMCLMWLQRTATAGLAMLAALGMGLVAAPRAEAQAYVSATLHSFANSGSDGQTPYLEGLIKDASSNLYGTTSQWRRHRRWYRVRTGQFRGTYSETVLYSFTNSGGDGSNPYGSLIMDASGNLYGTTGKAEPRRWHRIRTG